MKQFKFNYVDGSSEVIYGTSLQDIFGILFNGLAVTTERAMIEIGIDSIEYE